MASRSTIVGVIGFVAVAALLVGYWALPFMTVSISPTTSDQGGEEGTGDVRPPPPLGEQEPPPPPPPEEEEPPPPSTSGSIEVCVANEDTSLIHFEIRYFPQNDDGGGNWRIRFWGPAILNPGQSLCATIEDLSLEPWVVWVELVDESGNFLRGICDGNIIYLSKSNPDQKATFGLYSADTCTWPP